MKKAQQKFIFIAQWMKSNNNKRFYSSIIVISICHRELNDQKNITEKCYTVIILFNTKYSKIYLKQTLRLNYHQKLKVTLNSAGSSFDKGSWMVTNQQARCSGWKFYLTVPLYFILSICSLPAISCNQY